MTRYLRIAAAIVFALLALAFAALWVRSYFRATILTVPLVGNYGFQIQTDIGVINLVTFHHFAPMPWDVLDVQHRGTASAASRMGNPFQFSISRWGLDVAAPHWFLAASSLSLAALFAFKKSWRFTTRGLLIATTVVAGVFGLIAYSL